MLKKISFPSYIFLLLGICFYACSGSNSNTDKTQLIKYNFVMTDSNNTSLSEGELVVESFLAKKISGNYKITKMYADKVNGLKSKGKFEGTADDQMQNISINMNPKIADANLFITAKVSGDSLNGTWAYSTIKGVTSAGFFKSVKSN